MIVKTYKWHPQPSSVKKSTVAAKRAGIRGQSVLDCFCGSGSHAIASINAGAAKFTGTDIEDYSFCLRKDIARFNVGYATFGGRTVIFKWNVDATVAIKTCEHDVLFIDPPNPYQISGGRLASAVRDTGLSGNEMTKFWKERFCESNWINKKEETIKNVKDVIIESLHNNKRVIANLFIIKSNGFDYSKMFKDEFKIVQLYDSYFEIK